MVYSEGYSRLFQQGRHKADTPIVTVNSVSIVMCKGVRRAQKQLELLGLNIFVTGKCFRKQKQTVHFSCGHLQHCQKRLSLTAVLTKFNI